MPYVLKTIVIIAGIVFLAYNLKNIVNKKMDIGIGSGWTIVSLVFVVFGILFDFHVLLTFTRLRNVLLITCIVFAIVMTLYTYGIHITKIKNEIDDLTMWVSLDRSVVQDMLEATPHRSCITQEHRLL